MKNIIKRLLLCIYMFPLIGCGEYDADKLTGTVTVVDDNGNPIENAKVLLRYGYTPIQSLHKEALASSLVLEQNPDGIYTFEVWGSSAGVEVNAEGYWIGADGTGEPKEEDLVPGTTNTYHYDLQVVLKRTINPRPLYVHSMLNFNKLLDFDTEYGYDLERADLVRPHGRGVKADFIFTMTGQVEENDEHDVTIRLSFPNEHDGILPVRHPPLEDRKHSRLLLSQEAPTEGYLPVWERRVLRRWEGHFPKIVVEPPDNEISEIEGFWFRIHTEIDPETGEIMRARYGKLTNELSMGFRRNNRTNEHSGGVRFSYLYAPDHSRSVEWDGENTLVPGGRIQGLHRHR